VNGGGGGGGGGFSVTFFFFPLGRVQKEEEKADGKMKRFALTFSFRRCTNFYYSTST